MLVYLDLQLHREKAIYNGFSKNRISDKEVEHVVKIPRKIGDAGTHDLLQVCFMFASSQQHNRCKLAMLHVAQSVRTLSIFRFEGSDNPKTEGEYHLALVTGIRSFA